MDPIPPEPSAKVEFPPPAGKRIENVVALKNGETITLHSVQIEKISLFHGSPISGIREFREAEESTIGEGLYGTSSKDVASKYAVVRSPESTQRFVYEVEVADLNILDLTTPGALDELAKLMREKLSDLQGKIKAENETVKWWTEEKLRQTIELIDRRKYRGPKDILFSYGHIAREALMDLGYDGLRAMEGGEGGHGITIGNHDSYVIFDPKKARVVNEEPVALKPN